MLSALEVFYVEEKTKRGHVFHSSFMYVDIPESTVRKGFVILCREGVENEVRKM